METIHKENLDKIIDKLTNCKISVFCGAGISYNSGLPVVYQFIEAVLSKFGISDNEKQLIHNSGYPFEAFFEMLQHECQTDTLMDIFGQGDFNTNHLLLAWMIKKKLVHNIVSTNFDQLIEHACHNLNLKEDKDYCVFRTEASFAGIDWYSPTPNLIKIHGCASDLESMAINMKMVANSSVSTNKKSVVEHFFNKNENPVVLILGYSCSDVFDISPAIETLENEFSEVILIEHIFDATQQREENLAIQVDKNPFKKCTQGKRLFVSTDFMVEQFWKKNRLGAYNLIKHPSTDWKANIDEWYSYTLRENTEGFKHHICGRLFYNLGEYDLSEGHYNQGIAIAYAHGKHATVASEIGNLAMNYNALGRYEDAKKYTNISLDIYRKLGNIQGELERLQILGNIYRNLRNYKNAESTLLSAVKMARAYGDESDVCTGLGNLALVYNIIGAYDEAIAAAEEGKALSHKLGIKQSEASQLSSLGRAFLSKGESDKAITCLTESVKITRLIKDYRNECMALINLATIFMVQNNFTKALKMLEEALPIAIKLKTQQNEGSIYFNMAECYRGIGDNKNSEYYLQKSLKLLSGTEQDTQEEASRARSKLRIVTDNQLSGRE